MVQEYTLTRVYKSEQNLQRHQRYNTSHFTIEGVFETLYISYEDMPTSHSMIYSIVKRIFGNKSNHQNEPNQRQHVHKLQANIINTYTFKE